MAVQVESSSPHMANVQAVLPTTFRRFASIILPCNMFDISALILLAVDIHGWECGAFASSR